MSSTRVALSATIHCLTGCAIGEVLGMVFGTVAGLADLPTIVLAVILAFFFGYGLTVQPLVVAGMAFGEAARIALAADTLSIIVMEVVDNAVMILIPKAIDTGLSDLLFWSSLAFSFAVAFVAGFPVNLWLVRRGLGHAAIHSHHH